MAQDAVFTFRMPAGIPGEVSRLQTYGATIKNEIQNSSTPFYRYGQLGLVDSNGARPIAAGDAAMPAAAVLGISVRPFPGGDITVAFPQGTVPFGSGTPPATGTIDLLKRGYMTVLLGGTAPATKGGAVYVYYGVDSGNHKQGGFEAASGANLWQLTNAAFEGPADANGNTEISFNL